MPAYPDYYSDIDPLSSSIPIDHQWYSDIQRQMDDTADAHAYTIVPKTRGVAGMDALYDALITTVRPHYARNEEDPLLGHRVYQRVTDRFFAGNSGMKYPEPPAEPTFWNTMYDALYGDRSNTVRQAPWLPNEEVFPYTSY